MPKVRAKFECVSIKEQEGYDQKSVEFVPVLEGSEENKSFAKYTPNGNIFLAVSNETQAANAFEVGKEYYVDFTPAN